MPKFNLGQQVYFLIWTEHHSCNDPYTPLKLKTGKIVNIELNEYGEEQRIFYTIKSHTCVSEKKIQEPYLFNRVNEAKEFLIRQIISLSPEEMR